MSILNALLSERALATAIKTEYSGEQLKDKFLELAELLDIDLEPEVGAAHVTVGGVVDTIEGPARVELLTQREQETLQSALSILNRLFS